MRRKKFKRGRRPGQLGKAHKALREAFSAATPDCRKNLIAQGITPELYEEWQHHDLAFLGNFSREVAIAALQLGRLVERYKKTLSKSGGILKPIGASKFRCHFCLLVKTSISQK